MSRRDPYEVLELSREASDAEIKSAYRRLALKYHPDRNPGDAMAEERFKELSEAYVTLRDPDLRARYDRYGSYSSPSGSAPDFSTVDWQTLFREADIQFSQGQWRTVSGGGGNLMFQALFGLMAGLMRQSGLLPGEDREAVLELSLEEARVGAQRRVRIPGPSVCPSCRGSGGDCVTCGGAGVLRGAEVEVSVPAGVSQGKRLRLKGLGGPGTPPGDAYVRVVVKLPMGAHLEGGELHSEVAVLPSEAAYGAKAKVHGLVVDIPPGSRDGDEIRLPRLGLAGGDLVLRLKVALFPALFRKVRDVFV